MAESFKHLVVREEREGISVQLHRPEKRNAFSSQLQEELTRCFTLLQEKPPRVVVLEGAGSTFCAGADIEWMKASSKLSVEENIADAQRLVAMFESARKIPAPIVAVVQGGAYGGGLGLVALSDVVVSEASAKFAFGEVRLGLLPGVVAAYVLPKIGLAWARYLFLTGLAFTADFAQHLGLVHRVAPSRDALGEERHTVIAALRKGSPKAQAATKRLLNPLSQPDFSFLEECVHSLAALRVGEEAQAGLLAFLEKRDPPWEKPSV